MLTLGEGIELLRVVKRLFALSTVLSVHGEAEALLGLASELGLTFYDAAYLYMARKLERALVTEDERLRNVASRHVKMLSVSELIVL